LIIIFFLTPPRPLLFKRGLSELFAPLIFKKGEGTIYPLLFKRGLGELFTPLLFKRGS